MKRLAVAVMVTWLCGGCAHQRAEVAWGLIGGGVALDVAGAAYLIGHAAYPVRSSAASRDADEYSARVYAVAVPMIVAGALLAVIGVGQAARAERRATAAEVAELRRELAKLRARSPSK